jgi:hypothetical protein
VSWHEHRVSPHEILCAIAVLLGLAFVVLPFGRREIESMRVSRTVAELRQTEAAALRFKTDTGRFPIHYGDYDPAVYPGLKNLTVEPPIESGITMWAGPYLDSTARTNAWGGLAHLYYSTTQFDLDGDGDADTEGANSYVVLTGLPSAAAARLDREIDGAADPRAGRLQIAGPAGGPQTAYFLIAD